MAMDDAETAILDEESIQGLRELGALEEIGRAFLSEGPQTMTALRDAARKRDFAALEHRAHALKGASLATGAKRVAMTSARIEQQAKSKVIDGIDELLVGLQRDFIELEPALEAAWMQAD